MTYSITYSVKDGEASIDVVKITDKDSGLKFEIYQSDHFGGEYVTYTEKPVNGREQRRNLHTKYLIKAIEKAQENFIDDYESEIEQLKKKMNVLKSHNLLEEINKAVQRAKN